MRIFPLVWAALSVALPEITCGEPGLTAQPTSQTANEGSSISLMVNATGTGRLTYQWQLAGQDLPGQTRSVLGFRPLQAADAGIYSVVISDSGGTVTSESAALSVRVSVDPPFDPDLQFARDDTGLTLRWKGEGSLERSSSLAGSWQPLGATRSPFRTPLAPATAFFRLRNPHPRTVPVIIPPAYDGEKRLPLIILLHGYSPNPGYTHDYMRLYSLAATQGFLYATPAGTREQNGSRHFWNATDACCNFQGSQVDDVAFLRSLIRTLINTRQVDPKRVYLVGHSNGGFMSYRMACEHPEMIAGIASLAGATYSNPVSCGASKPVNILQVHGTADSVIQYYGGMFGGRPHPGAMETVQNWADSNGCRRPVTERTVSMDMDLNVPGLDTKVTAFSACPPGGAVELWSINGGGHNPSFHSGANSSEFSKRVVDWLLAHPKP